MQPHPPSLADGVAGLRRATEADADRAWLAVHALILGLLARLFGRLEEMVRLWQAGAMPPARPPALRHLPPRSRSTRRLSAPRRALRRPRRAPELRLAAHPRPVHAPWRVDSPRLPAAHPPTPHAAARDPPRATPRNAFRPGPHDCALNTTI
jgi:hypothetical protein